MKRQPQIIALLLLLIWGSVGVAEGVNTPTATATSTATVTYTWLSSPTPGTVTPGPFKPLKLILNQPLTDPPNLSWATEFKRRLELPLFCPWDACKALEGMVGNTPTATATGTITKTPTITATATQTATVTNSPTPVATSTSFSTWTPTITATGTVTNTPTVTPTPTNTATPTVTQTPYFAWSIFAPSSGANIVADIPGDTATFTCLAPLVCTGTALTDDITFALQTFTPTGTFTVTPTFTNTPTWTVTATPTVTNTSINTATSTSTSTATATATGTVTSTPTATPTGLTYWSIFAPSSGANIVADTNGDTATMTGTSPIVITGTALTDVLVWSWDFTVANTWTGLQTFDAGILLKDNDTAAFGDSSDATISFDNSNLIIDPDGVTTTAGLKYKSLNTIEIGDGGGTQTSAVTSIYFDDDFTIDVASAAVNGIFAQRTITWEQDGAAYIDGDFFFYNDTHTNPAGETRTWSIFFTYYDGQTWNINTTPGTSTLGGVTSFDSAPAFTRTGAGAFNVLSLIGYTSAGTVGAGVTLTNRYGFQVFDLTNSGTITTQSGLDIANLTTAGTNWSMRIGTANSYFAGKIMFGGTGAPSDLFSVDGQSDVNFKMIQTTTGATAGKALLFQAGGATAAGTDLAGGTLKLSSGSSQGNGIGTVQIFGVHKQSTGSSTRSPAKQAEFQDSHLYFTGSNAPSVGTCGTTPSISGTDSMGAVTTGSGAATACTITFGTQWTNTPACWCTVPAATAAARITAASTTAITCTYSSLASTALYYGCLGRN